jgi:type III secretion protein D
MNAPFAPTLERTMLLRVLSGRLSGAEHRLPRAKIIRIGHGFDHDIVLRDASTRGLSMELIVADEVATVTVLAGEASLLGRPLGAGDTGSLPVFVPLLIGAFAIAIGDTGSARWDDVARLSTQLAAPDPAEAPRADLGERLATRLYPARRALLREGRWPFYGLGAAVLVLAAVAFTPTVGWVNGQVYSAAGLTNTLRAAGFGDLRITDPASGSGPLIQGVVRDDAELGRLRLVVADRIGRAQVDVETMQGIAAAATDMLRAQGVDADARPMRGTTLLVTSEYLPPDRQTDLAALIRRDLPRVTSVAFKAEGARGDRDLQYFFSGGTMGLATFVDGNPGYIVTADGTRWFAGAQVPTGHRIVGIGNGRVRFERAGQVEELVLGDPPQIPPQLATATSAVSVATPPKGM